MTTLVLGAAVSGQAAVRVLDRLGHDVVVYDADRDRATAVAGDRHRAVGGEWDPSFLEGVDLVVTSPGVPEHHPAIAATLEVGIPLWSEVELAARHIDAPIAAVTGTNGKTTVTELAASMLRASGLKAAAVGNIGDPLCDAVGEAHEVLVVEASSFQLRFIDRFHPEAAVLLNLAPDHLDWHGTFDAYADAKARIFENQVTEDILAFDADDPVTTQVVAPARARLVGVSGRRLPDGGSGVDGDTLWISGHATEIGGLARTDAVFLVDAAAAGVVADRLGATPDGIRAALADYRPGAHRRELVAEHDGIHWINDSKATNPHAALASIDAHSSVVLIAGGRNKGLDVGPLGAHPAVRYVIGLGEAGPEIVAAAAAGETVADMEAAVETARRRARPGDTVLLAPGCASFDMFESYGARGDRFRALAKAVV